MKAGEGGQLGTCTRPPGFSRAGAPLDGQQTALPRTSCRKTWGQIMASSGVKQTVVPHQCSASWLG